MPKGIIFETTKEPKVKNIYSKKVTSLVKKIKNKNGISESDKSKQPKLNSFQSKK